MKLVGTIARNKYSAWDLQQRLQPKIDKGHKHTIGISKHEGKDSTLLIGDKAHGKIIYRILHNVNQQNVKK